MPNQRIIGLDCDGVLADFNRDYIELIVARTGKDLFPARPFTITTWEYPELYGYSRTEIKKVWHDIITDDSFWARLLPYSDARQFLDDLWDLDHDNVYFITQRPGQTAKVQTEFWLKTLLGWDLPTVLVSGEKGSVCKDLQVTH